MEGAGEGQIIIQPTTVIKSGQVAVPPDTLILTSRRQAQAALPFLLPSPWLARPPTQLPLAP